MQALEVGSMAKKPVGRPREDGPGKPVRLAADLVIKARHIALANGEPMSEYLARILAPTIEKDFRALAKRMGEEGK